MKRLEVIDKLKAGGKIVYSTGIKPTANFINGETVNMITVINLQKESLVETRESEKSYGLYYITWKGESKNKRSTNMKVIRVEFEGQGQDLLWWDIRVKDGALEVGEVIDCGPYHHDLYVGSKVYTFAPYKVGDQLHFATPSGKQLTLKYPIIKVTEKES